MPKHIVRAVALLTLVPAIAVSQASIVIPGAAGFQLRGFGAPGAVFGQTFRTPDAVNTRLTSFTFFLLPDLGQPFIGIPAPPAAVGTLRAAVYQFDGTGTVGAPLFQSSAINIPTAVSVGTPVPVLTGGTSLMSGQQYVALFETLPGSTGGVAFSATVATVNPVYTNGQIIIGTGGASGTFDTSLTTVDLRAELQFVPGVAAVVPEPATVALLATGVLIVGGVARHRGRRG